MVQAEEIAQIIMDMLELAIKAYHGYVRVS